MEFVLLIGLVFGIVVYRRRADGRRVDIGLMARRLFEFGFLYGLVVATAIGATGCLLYTSPSPRDRSLSRMPSSA